MPVDPSFSHWRWWTVVLRGIAAVIFGILAVASPTAAFMSLVVVFGVYAIVDGLLTLGLAVRSTTVPHGVVYGRGVVSILAGVLALAWPHISAAVLLVVIASWAIVAGIMEIITAYRMRRVIDNEWWVGLEGAVSIAFGVLLFISPAMGVVVIGLWVGIYALIVGGMLIAAGVRMREIDHRWHATLPHAA